MRTTNRSEDAPFSLQTAASRLIVSEQFVVQAATDEVRIYRSSDMSLARSFPLRAYGLGFVHGGNLAVLAPAAGQESLSLHLLDPGSGAVKAVYPRAGQTYPRRALVMASGKPEEIYIAYRRRNEVTRFELVDGATPLLAPTQLLSIDDSEQHTLVGLGGKGLLYANSGSFVKVAPDKSETRFENPETWVKHLGVASGDDRVWFSKLSKLYLAQLAASVRVVQAVDLSPFTIVHLHAQGTGAALLLADGSDPSQVRWAVAVVAEDGKERWRRDVTASQAQGGFVASSATRVVVGSTGKLQAWDAATGTPVGI